MSYELRPDEAVPDALRRLADEELAAAARLLRAVAHDPVRAIHQARKRCKQARTVLRLARSGALAETAYRRESLVIRNAARRIGGVRDAQVALQTLDALRDAAARDDELGARLEPLARRLAARRERVVAAALGPERRVATAVRQLTTARSRIQGWPLRGTGFLVGPGLEKLYGQGKDRLSAATADPASEHLHDLRKRVKDLWHATRILRPVWPGPLQAAAVEWHRLSDLLGDEHDLVAMRALAAGELGEDAAVVLQTIDLRRAELWREARTLAERLFLERPAAFAERLRGWWECWRGGTISGAREEGT